MSNDSNRPLTAAQVRMLQRAAIARNGAAYVRRGQSSTAEALRARGLVEMYSPDAYSTKVCITPEGRTALTTALPGQERP